MRTVGLITEYNPFHNGHLHHLRESLQAAEAEVSVAVMSGHFLQRGEPALVDKWLRAEMALAAGVDLVIELPFPWACNSAPYFALGAVQSLNALAGVDALCFGSEAGELPGLQQAAEVLQQHQQSIAEKTGQLLRQGISYPAARAQLVAELSDDLQIAQILGQPNNILGIEYLQALKKTTSAIMPLTIQRIGAGFHQTDAVGEVASATGIRKMLSLNSDVSDYLPKIVHSVLLAASESGRQSSEGKLLTLLISRLNLGAASLREIYQIENGLENRLVEMAAEARVYKDFVTECKSRQLTRTRIQRVLCYLLNGVEKELMSSILERGPLYLHLLGSSDKGERFLARYRKEFSLPVVGNYSRIHSQLKKWYGVETEDCKLAEKTLELELRTTRNYTLLMQRWAGGNRNRDYFESARRKGSIPCG